MENEKKKHKKLRRRDSANKNQLSVTTHKDKIINSLRKNNGTGAGLLKVKPGSTTTFKIAMGI